jgi:hypothetical protein
MMKIEIATSKFILTLNETDFELTLEELLDLQNQIDQLLPREKSLKEVFKHTPALNLWPTYDKYLGLTFASLDNATDQPTTTT